jgi:sensor histidine kinase regulating citrate/malate metabolism
MSSTPTELEKMAARVEVRLGAAEREVERLRVRSHETTGRLAALQTLIEVGSERQEELIRRVAELRGEMESGFGRRDRFARWLAGIAVAGVPATFAAVAAIWHT